MKYMGSKARFAKEILSVIAKDRNSSIYIEPFAGGMNMISEVPSSWGRRIANDINPYLISLFKYVIAGGELPKHVTNDERKFILSNPNKCSQWAVGYAGFICGFGGDFNGGFAGYYPEHRRLKNGKLPSYQEESKNSLIKQCKKLTDVEFSNKCYTELMIPPNSIVYFDPPYKGTTGYNKSEFDSDKFFNYVRATASHSKVFVSEYTAPDDFTEIWSKETQSQLSATGYQGGTKLSVEKLFTFR